MSNVKISSDALRDFCIGCFKQRGVPETDARLTAENLIFANLRGVDSHGVIRLKIYLDRLKVGGFKADAVPSVATEQESSAVIDGGHGLGQVAATAAMKLAILKASHAGVAFVSTKNSNHFGACAFYAVQGLQDGMIGFAATNAGPSMAPTGGREARLGNNAFAVAIPAGKYPPIILDMATGAVAWGKIFVAQQENRKIPTTWALDKHGVPTDDPNAAAHQGLIQPFGGYKGYGLSLLIDILTGVLSGAGFSTHVRTLYKDVENPSQVGHLCGALRIESFIPLDAFSCRIEEFIDMMRSSAKAPGVERILVPGEIEHEIEQKRRADGIPLNDTLLAELRGLASELSVRFPL